MAKIQEWGKMSVDEKKKWLENDRSTAKKTVAKKMSSGKKKQQSQWLKDEISASKRNAGKFSGMSMNEYLWKDK